MSIGPPTEANCPLPYISWRWKLSPSSPPLPSGALPTVVALAFGTTMVLANAEEEREPRIEQRRTTNAILGRRIGRDIFARGGPVVGIEQIESPHGKAHSKCFRRQTSVAKTTSIDSDAPNLLRSQTFVTTFSGVHRFHFATSASYWRWYLHPEGVHAR